MTTEQTFELADISSKKYGFGSMNSLPSESTTRSTIADTKADGGDGDAEHFCLHWEANDPRNPMNWSNLRKWYVTMANGVLVLSVTFASSAPSGIAQELMDEFQFSSEVAVLLLALFVAGYCLGPIAWGPLSEQVGRRPIFMTSFFGFTMFQIAMALSTNTASLLIFRFLGGVFAACPASNSAAVIGDIFDAKTRGKALAIFTVTPFTGPFLGPLVSGYIGSSDISWRWIFWITSIFAGVCLLLVIFTLPETYQPILLKQLANEKRKSTGDARYYAPIEKNQLPFRQQMERILMRPFMMLFYEPMLMASTIFSAFIYGCIYLFFEAYPVLFVGMHHLTTGQTGLTFLPLLFGGVAGVIVYALVMNPRYEREAARLAPKPVPPEFRLEIVIIAAPVLCVSFFWFGWTSFPSVSYWAPMMAGFPIGFALIWIFLGLFNYIIDTYLFAAASAFAANTIVRSLFGTVFPLFASQMYETLNPRWASSLLGFISLAMIPIPIIFVKYGPRLRQRSKYAPRRPAMAVEV